MKFYKMMSGLIIYWRKIYGLFKVRLYFHFHLDAVLLARFAYVPIRSGKIVDLCAGNGAIPLFLSARTNADIIAVELQERLANMAERSVQYNGLENRIRIVNDDVIGIAAKMVMKNMIQ